MGSGRKCGVVLIVPAADAAHTKLPKIMSAKSGNALATVLVAAAIVAALYFGREEKCCCQWRSLCCSASCWRLQSNSFSAPLKVLA